MGKRILVVAAHADDETLGCGGTIARHSAEGDSVYLVLLADGVQSRRNASEVEYKGRIAAATLAQEILGIKESFHFDFPDQRMDSLSLLDIVKPIEEVISRLHPEVIYTHHSGDLNRDHQIACQAVMTACRPQPGHSVKEIYGFEVVSSTEWAPPGLDPFLPVCYSDISDFLETKIQACLAYSEEMRVSPHSRSIDHVRALARHRGHCVGFQAAEAFTILRILK